MKDKETPIPSLQITGDAKGNVFDNCTVIGSVKIDKHAEDNRFIESSVIPVKAFPSLTGWYERPLGMLTISFVASLIATAVWYFFF